MAFFAIDNFLTLAECDELIGQTDNFLKEEQCDTVFDRTTVTDQRLAKIACDRLKERLQNLDCDQKYKELLNTWDTLYVHPRWFWTRYRPGGTIKKHRDGYRTDVNSKSTLTILIYLNADFTGGQTSFEQGEVSPKAGRLALVAQDSLHWSQPISGGTKYLLRSDLMLKSVEETHAISE